MGTPIHTLSDAELDHVSGGRISLANIPNSGQPQAQVFGGPGAGDTIDGIPWGGKPGDGSWQTVNGNLPGGGWGNGWPK